MSGHKIRSRRFYWTLFGLGAVALLCIRAAVTDSGYGIALAVSPSMEEAILLRSPPAVQINRSDIVIFNMPRNPYTKGVAAKRVVGIEGDVILIKEGQVYVAGDLIGPVNSETLKGKPLTPTALSVVPKGHIFVAGTHDRSFDSRYDEFGTIPLVSVSGMGRILF